jgi:hypothetical protein
MEVETEVETEPNVYEQYEEYVKQVEVKQSDDISAEVDDEKNVYVIGDNEVEECSCVPREVSFRLPRNLDSLRLPRNWSAFYQQNTLVSLKVP